MITVTPHHFTGRDEAISRVRESGLYLAEAELSQAELTGAEHVHPYDVDIYVLDGVLELYEARTGLRHRLEAGSRAQVPAETLHAESCPGRFHAVFGVSVDPAPLMAARLQQQA
jgi:hypothetical protein